MVINKLSSSESQNIFYRINTSTAILFFFTLTKKLLDLWVRMHQVGRTILNCRVMGSYWRPHINTFSFILLFQYIAELMKPQTVWRMKEKVSVMLSFSMVVLSWLKYEVWAVALGGAENSHRRDHQWKEENPKWQVKWCNQNRFCNISLVLTATVDFLHGVVDVMCCHCKMRYEEGLDVCWIHVIQYIQCIYSTVL